MAPVPSPAGDLRARELELLAESTRTLSASLNLGEVLDRLAAMVGAQLDADLVRIWLLDQAKGTLVLSAQTGAVKNHVHYHRRIPSREGIAGWVLAHAEPLRLVDARSDPRVVNRAWFEAEGIASVMLVPIVLGGTPIGVLACMSRTAREFSDADLALAEVVAAPAAVALRNATAHAEALDRLEEIQAFQRLTSETLSNPDLATTLASIAREARSLLGGDGALCSLVNPQTLEVEAVVTAGAAGAPAGDVPRDPLKPGQGLSGLAVAEGRAVISDDCRQDARFSPDPARDRWAEREGVVSVAAAPVVDAEGRTIALLWVHSREPAHFTPLHEERLGRLARHAAVAIGQAWRFEEDRRRAGETAALLEIARTCTSTLELMPLLKEIAQQTAQALDVERCSVALWRGRHLVPVMAQFADGHADPALWARFRAMATRRAEEVPAHAEAIRTKRPVIVEDARGSTLLAPDWVEDFGIRAALIVPMVAKDQVIGTLNLDDTREPRSWSPAQMDLAMTIAAQVALALENATNYADAQHRASEVAALAAVGEALSSTLDLQRLFETVADSALKLSEAQGATVFDTDIEAGCLRARVSRGLGTPAGIPIRLGHGAPGQAVARRAPFWVADVQSQPLPGYDEPDSGLGRTLGDTVRELGFRGVLAVPVVSRDTVLGAVCVYWDHAHEVEEREVGLLSALARQAAVALDNARLVRDIRHTVDDLKAAQDTLVRGATLRAVGELAAGAAHHLNNLLAVVLGRTQLLLMREPPEAMRASLKTIERSAMDAADTVRRIQAFSRTDHGADASEIELNAAVQEALQLTRPRWEHEAQLRGLRIDVAFEPGPLPKLVARGPEIREAVANLILNAVDAMPAGGRVLVRTWRDGSRALVSVEDTGVGMPEVVRRRVFEPFFTTKGVKSTGLGLPVAYGIVRRHGGEISVESREGQGTKITFWLPLGDSGAGVGLTVDGAASAPAAPVLVIDDEAAMRDLVSEVLSARGHAVTTAADGRDGLARFTSGRYDLVITDLGMPGMTGWDVARAINARSPDTPILLLTGWGETLAVPEGTRVDAVVAKPFDVVRLTAAVTETLQARRRPAG